MPSRAPFPGAQAPCWVSRRLPGRVAAPAPQSGSMLLYKDASTRQARFALSRVRCVRACTRGDVDAYFRWLRYPATRPGAVDPFLPAGQQAAAGDARTPTHARRMHGRKKRAIRADPPSVMRPGVDMRAVVAGSGTACICCAPRASQHHARVCRLAGCTQARPAGSTPYNTVPATSSPILVALSLHFYPSGVATCVTPTSTRLARVTNGRAGGLCPVI